MPISSLSQLPRDVSPRDWNDWRWQLRNAITTPEDLSRLVSLTDQERAGLAAMPGRFRVGATPYYFSLLDRDHPHCPVRRQVIPLGCEAFSVPLELPDPLEEGVHAKAPALLHKYPDRVLLLAVDRCAVYCRHCNRRRLVGADDAATRADLEAAFAYIARTRCVRDVLVSGGDPLCLSTAKLTWILDRLRAIPHVEIIRIGTRVPVTLPMRIDAELCATLRRYHPLYVNTHFNHPKEISPEAAAACERLADAGIPVGNQTVLLRGINSSVRCLRRLFRDLLRIRVRPYYLFQCDPVMGTDHLRTPVEKAMELMAGLRSSISGLAIPHLVLDAPGRGGKIFLEPGRIVELRDDVAVLRTCRGGLIQYPQPAERDMTVPYDEVFFADEPPEGGID